MPKVLVFGASGAIGSALCDWFESQSYAVLAVSRQAVQANASSRQSVAWGLEQPDQALSSLPAGSVDAVVWAQGQNVSDSIHDVNFTTHQSMYEANVVYILKSLQILLQHKILAPSARLCIISSIWQQIARQNKLSYCVTKSALQGLVHSLTIDLGKEGYLVNAVLPGALDTAMTRANLSPQQLSSLEALTPLGSLATLCDVCQLVGFLCSSANTGITGQFIAADKGFSYARII